ncbi:cell division protein ZipA [Celerinatantimonas diazotrophica]|uniref:Cell division protein ZipA n=1 Tax=Celerinatantimonas diazotrophica TaxID=412034 RepID=A0A4R1K4J7_9GAMM|nr:cell division protein ZipA [Celerinatantimonas diazotrophica]TCK58847.1 cell division protein ZipA [Celerinatantimonas diazotrophica]CAG9297479.1 Cell division protein ZipA [Celerinatantimonas diazotrophica]
MHQLRIVLIIIGIIAIVGLLAHGFMSNRRNRPERLVTKKVKPRRKKTRVTEQSIDDEPLADDQDDGFAPNTQEFDDLGVGEVRVVNRDESQDNSPQRVEPQVSFDESSDELAEQNFSEAEPEIVVSEPVPQDEAQVEPQPKQAADEPQAKPQSKPAAPDDVYILNVVAPNGQIFDGQKLLECLTGLGLKYGEMNIFHRHQQANGQGPVLFSVANIVKPGTFDPDHMDEFTTHGVSLFMTVPCPGEPSRNFNVMYNAAERIVRDMDAILLDGHRNPFTAQTLQHYQQRIREYERQQLLHSSQ